ncbi:MAG: alpha-ketoacid dehydrogenase subunit beta [Holosporales bacterium]|jgi:pyruvate dehydrogenase E1 component beta subunit|nr:alpha-ketoacid dehydrogenase subunit beta [Holosporales bacterium]
MSDTMQVRTAIRDAIAEEMRRDRSVFLMGEEVGRYNGAYKASQGLLDEFGEQRVIDTPITEYGFAGIGVGTALAGLRPIVEFMTFNFAMQAIDHIVNSAAKTLYMSGGAMHCPIVFRGPNGVPRGVAAQHSQCFAGWYAHVPGLKVVAPYTAMEAKCLLKAAIRDDNPVVFLEHEVLYGQQFEMRDDIRLLSKPSESVLMEGDPARRTGVYLSVHEDSSTGPTQQKNDCGELGKKSIELLPLDKAVIMRHGTDITITAFSISVMHAMEAAGILWEKHGISAEVINLISLRPIDRDTIVNSVMKTGRIINIEEGWSACGIGSEIISIVTETAFDYLDAEPVRITSADVPMPYSKQLEDLALPNVDMIVNRIARMCGRR